MCLFTNDLHNNISFFSVLLFTQVEYNQREIRDLLQRVDFGNRPKSTKAYEKGSVGLIHRGSAFGILGNIDWSSFTSFLFIVSRE